MKVMLKGVIDEDFVNYKKPSMYLAFPYCSFKCEEECGRKVCQNSALAQQCNIQVSASILYERYQKNPITKAIVCGGLEPFDSWNSLKQLVRGFRTFTQDPIVIYTGYKEGELAEELKWLRQYRNILVKFGRFIPDKESHYDKILGVELASPNQYGKWIGGNDEDQS